MSELHAVRPVSTALDRTIKLLFRPFDLGLWLKLVIITFFVGGGPGTFNPGSNLQSTLNRNDYGGATLPDFHGLLANSTVVAAIVLLILVALILVLVMYYLRAVFSFVLIDALTSGQASIVRQFRANMGRGFKVFLFNVATGILSLIVLGCIVIVMLLAVLSMLDSLDGSTLTSTSRLILFIGVLILCLIAILIFSVIMGLIVGFVYDFALPLMFFRGMGFRQAAGHVLGMVKKSPVEFLVYVLVRWLLELVATILLAIVSLFFLAIFVITGLIVAIAMFEAAKTSLALAAIFLLALLCGVLLLAIVTAIVSMPFRVYFRYYSLDFLRSFDPSYVAYTGKFAEGRPNA